jgi:hypothetical protein
VLTPEQDANTEMSAIAKGITQSERVLETLPVLIATTETASGRYSQIAYRTHLWAAKTDTAALPAGVEMLITTFTAEVPGVTGVAGLKLHDAPDGRPAVHARLTGASNELPIGWIVRL